MGKRNWKGGKGSKPKRQRAGSLLEPGQYGIYASCNRGREMKAAKELKVILNDMLGEFYSEEPNHELTEDEDDEDEVEDAIRKEVAALQKQNKANSGQQLITEIPISAESLLFFHMKQPIVPSEFTPNICQLLYSSKVKNSRFVQRLTPIDKSCNATMDEFTRMATPVLKENVKPGMSYSVNLTRRNFTNIDRDDFMEEVAKILPESELHYKGADKMIHVYCFKNNIGISVTDYTTFEKLCKFNLQQIFDKSNDLLETAAKENEHSKHIKDSNSKETAGADEVAAPTEINGDEAKEISKEDSDEQDLTTQEDKDSAVQNLITPQGISMCFS
ncbi:DEKNAAC101256 [Brettanomyces naardenensis]|uniref:DEKNAAC101256 n=1 Tax=Brettanomyces naardenensis TaxID=13370 RepID=A0A448YHJ2_BRENA|nr:DEKNAAC101256 [Brettanomyces naardenensis]